MKPLSSRWKNLPPRQRHFWAGGLCGALALLYGLLLWYPGRQALQKLQYQEEKMAVRLKTSGKSDGKPPAVLDLGGLNPGQARQELERVHNSLGQLEAEQQRLNGRFIPLEDLESLQALKSELTRLAESGDMEVVALEHIYREEEDRDRPPTVELLKEAAQANPYKRPLLRLKARASYRGLMQFLDGLGSLTHIAAPVWSQIQVQSAKPNPDGNPLQGSSTPKQWLEVEIRLAV